MTGDSTIKAQVRAALGPSPDALPPHSLPAEEALLGCLLLAPDAMAEAACLVEPRDFFLVRHEWIFEAMLAVWRAGQEVDAVTVTEALGPRAVECEGAIYLTGLSIRAQSGVTRERVQSYARIIQRTSDRRKLLEYHRTGYISAATEEKQESTLFTEAMQHLMDAKPRSLDHALTPGTAVLDRFLEMQSREEGEVTIFPLPFGGDKGLPFMTGGKLFGIGGDEKTGKSALAETLSEHWARLGLRGFYIHTEESPDDKINRRYSRWSGIPFLQLEAGQLSGREIEKRALAITITSAWEDQLDWWHEPIPSPASIQTLIVRAIQMFRVKFIVVDNFTDIDFSPPQGIHSTTTQRMSAWLQEIGFLASKYHVLIVLVTQMTTQESGKRIAHGTSGFNKKMAWFWDINRKTLKEPLNYEADGEIITLQPGAFDPRVDIYVPASRYGSGAMIPVFADLRRFLWRDRTEVLVDVLPPTTNRWNDLDDVFRGTKDD